MGGLGIQNPTLTAETEFRNSSIVTENLTRIIVNQEDDLVNYNDSQVNEDIKKIKLEKEENLLQQMQDVDTRGES